MLLFSHFKQAALYSFLKSQALPSRPSGRYRLRGRGQSPQLTVLQQHPFVTELRYRFGMGDDDHGLAEFFRQLAENSDDFLFGCRIKISGRFVRKDQIDVGRQRRAIAIRCCSPPDSLEIGRSALERTIPTFSSNA